MELWTLDLLYHAVEMLDQCVSTVLCIIHPVSREPETSAVVYRSSQSYVTRDRSQIRKTS